MESDPGGEGPGTGFETPLRSAKDDKGLSESPKSGRASCLPSESGAWSRTLDRGHVGCNRANGQLVVDQATKPVAQLQPRPVEPAPHRPDRYAQDRRNLLVTQLVELLH